MIIDQHHWMGRPRACHYYRRINELTGDETQRNWTQVSIVTYDWATAQRLATVDPQQLTATQIWKQPSGD